MRKYKETGLLACVFLLTLGLCIKPSVSNPMPTNCLDIMNSADKSEPKQDGIYEIYADSTTMLRVYCEMFKGGWTRIMNRVDNSLSFNKPLNDYIVGFGPLKQNHWLGLRYCF